MSKTLNDYTILIRAEDYSAYEKFTAYESSLEKANTRALFVCEELKSETGLDWYVVSVKAE